MNLAGASVYQTRINDNFGAMGTSSSEWRAVPITGVSEVEVNGKIKSMPNFDFPKGYAKAPTLYPINVGGEMNCELCGRMPIKTAYYIQNDKHQWTLIVGSECVKNFEDGKSGKENLRQFKINSAMMLANDISLCGEYIKSNFSRIKEERDFRGFVKKTRDWKSIYVGNATNYLEKEQLTELKESGKLDVLFATSKSSATKDYVNWYYVYEKLPFFTESADSENYEKQLLSWFKRNETKARDFLQAVQDVGNVVSDDKINFVSLELVEPDKFQFGGNLFNWNYDIGGL